MALRLITSFAIALLAGACAPDATDDQSTTDGSDNALLQAAGQGDAHRVRVLLDRGARVDATDAEGRTPLMIATYANDVETARVLVEAGADIDRRDDIRNNPFLYAGAEGQLEILRLVAKAGADPRLTNRYGGTALIPASEHGHVEVIRFLLEETDIDVNHVNNLGWTALLEAVILGEGEDRQARVVELLLRHGADPAIADRDGVTSLAHARRRGFDRIAELLERAERD